MVALGAFATVLGVPDSFADSAVAPSDVYEATDSSSFALAPLVRSGLYGGLSFGRGSIEVICDSCIDGGGTLTEALSVEGHLGFMLTPQIGIVGEHWNVRYNQRGGSLFDDTAEHLVAQHITTVGAQLFLGGSFWFRTGLGVGWHITDGEYANKKNPQGHVFFAGEAFGEGSQPSSEESLSGVSPAYYAAVGWEFAHTSALAAEVQLRVAGTQRPSDEYQVRNVGLNVGMSWY